MSAEQPVDPIDELIKAAGLDDQANWAQNCLKLLADVVEGEIKPLSLNVALDLDAGWFPKVEETMIAGPHQLAE